MSVAESELVRAEYPTAPQPDPIEGTLLNIVTPVETSDGRRRIPGGIGLFPSFNCLDTGFELGALCGPTDGSKFDEAVNPVWQDGLGFGAYGAVICKLADPAVLREGVERSYSRAESRIVEAAIMAGLFVEQTATSTLGGWDAAVDITPTPGTAVDPVVGLGLLESHMAVNYAGKGLLHMPRLVATLLDQRGALKMESSVLYTGLRTPVAAGGGYDLPNTGPDGGEGDEGEKWIYATGAVSITRQKMDVREFFNIFSQQADDQEPNYISGLDPNDQGALTESLYLVSIDCYKAAVLVTAYANG
jgi:hypothetical protein